MRQTLFLLPAALVLCLAVCKEEPDLPPDPHVPLVNTFIGVWKADTQYWQFKTDGTGGRAVTETGPFPDAFSFFVYAGQDVRTAPSQGSLLILEGSPINITRYEFSIVNNQATLNHIGGGGGVSVPLERVSGSPQALSLTNPLIGEWTTKWSTNGSTWGTGINRWSLKYRADGTVKTYHHSAGHQFENGYGLRGNTLVTFGSLRFGGLPATNNAPVLATLTPQIDGTWRVKELQTTLPATGTNLVEWIYTKVDAAQWKEE